MWLWLTIFGMGIGATVGYWINPSIKSIAYTSTLFLLIGMGIYFMRFLQPPSEESKAENTDGVETQEIPKHSSSPENLKKNKK